MAPVNIQAPASLLPITFVILHLIVAAWITYAAARSIYRSYVALPPSSATRHRQQTRMKYVRWFSALALLSLLVTGICGFKFASLSYRVWAAERGIELPNSIFGDKGGLRGGEHPGRLHLIQWLNDTPVYQDAFEIVTEKARFFWWGQQITLGMISWSIYLSIEGHKRNISNLWAFMALAQLVSLSFAQNMFFLAVLLTPVPLPGNARQITRASVPGTSNRISQLLEKIPTKPEGWTPSPMLYYALLIASFSSVLLQPFSVNTPSFMDITALCRLIPICILALPYVIPESWGTTHTDPHGSYPSYTRLFQVISIVSGLLNAKATVLAVFYNMSVGSSYKHGLLHPFKEEQLSSVQCVVTAANRIFGALLEHPAISAIAWDIMMSGLSLGIWASTRASNPDKMLTATIPFFPVEYPATAIKEKVAELEEPVQSMPPPPVRRGRGRPRKVSNPDPPYVPGPSEQMDAEGDEDTKEDWEIGLLAWGLMMVGGLGVGNAGVYCAEVTSHRG